MPNYYEIRIKGRLGAEWAAYFDGFKLEPVESGETILTGEIVDQAALHGLLGHIRDLGLPLLAINPVAGRKEQGAARLNFKG